MDLREYLFRKRKTYKAFAEEINYSPSRVMDVAHKRKKPGRKFIQAVEKATNGEVNKEDLM